MTTEGTFETTVEVGTEFLVRRAGRRGESAYDELAARWQDLEALAAQVAQTTLDPVPDDGAADGTTDHEADARHDDGVLADEVDDHGVAAAAAARARDAAQIVTPSEAVLCGEHGREGTGPVEPAQTARLLRPLRRRADRIERPARVRMRSRNPCVL